jgi:hypothetical protein
MVSTSPKTRRNGSLTTGRHTIGGAPPPEAISAHAQDDLEEWFPLGLTCALVLRKHRVLKLTDLTCLSRPKHKCSCLPSSEVCKLEIKGLHQHQDSRRDTKIWRFHQATRGRKRLQAHQIYPRSLNSSGPRLWLRNRLTLVEYFGYTR